MRELYFGNVPDNVEDIYRVIRTGDFNGYLVFNRVLIDVGIPFSAIKDHVYNLDMVLLTHSHGDHLNLTTLKRIQDEVPFLPVYAGVHLEKTLVDAGIKNINIIKEGLNYERKGIMFKPFSLTHDVPNIGYHLRDFETKKTVIHMTDTGQLPMETAFQADVVAIEFNHDETMMDELIDEGMRKTGFSHYMSSRFNHLSFQKARFFIEQRTQGEEKITVVKLHTSKFFQKYLPNA